MSLSSGTGSATPWDVGGRVNHEPSPHAEDGKARLAVADECANGLLGTNGGELREVEKRKKKRNPRNKKRGTGFEEYFCDAPMTLDEYNQEQNDLYPAHRPFVERIEECIQRFRARRHMNSEQDKFFSRYLLLGGVDATQRQFQGTTKMGKDELAGLSKAEVRDIAASDVIQRGGEGKHDTRFFNPDYSEYWDVDFAGVVAGYLSENLAQIAGVDIAKYETGVNVVSNFLKYVDRHDVCPEYSTDIHEALAICHQAFEEMPSICDTIGKFPGDFSDAACTLFCKGRKEDFEFDNSAKNSFDEQTARTIFGIHAALILDQERSRHLGKLMGEKEPVPIKTVDQTYEIVKIELPSEKHLAYYKQVNQHLKKDLHIRPCGYLSVRPTFVRDGYDRRMPEKAKQRFSEVDVVLVEKDILQSLKVGMKLDMLLCTVIDEGFKFIKYVSRIRPTFYTFLPQELMQHFREPVKTNHPAPNVDDFIVDEDPDAHQDILDSILIGEMSVEDESAVS